MRTVRHLRGLAASAAASLLLLSPPVSPAAQLIPLLEDAGQIGTFEWPRDNIRVLDSAVGQIDPVWTYEATVTGFHVSSGKMALPVKGRRLPAGFAEEAGLKKGGAVKLTVTGTGAESFTAGSLEGSILEIRKVPGEGGEEVSELVLGLPREAVAGLVLTATLKLPEPAAGIVLPADAVWTQPGEPPASYVFPWAGTSIRRVKVVPDLRTDTLVEIPEGVLPGEKYLGGSLQELYGRFELKAEPATPEQYVAPAAQANQRRIWSKFLIAWGLIGFCVAIWVAVLFFQKRSRRGKNTYRH